MQWVQDSSQSKVENLNNVRCEASRHFRNKIKDCLKVKLRNLKLTVSKKILGTYQSRPNIVKDDLVADYHSILAR